MTLYENFSENDPIELANNYYLIKKEHSMFGIGQSRAKKEKIVNNSKELKSTVNMMQQFNEEFKSDYRQTFTNTILAINTLDMSNIDCNDLIVDVKSKNVVDANIKTEGTIKTTNTVNNEVTTKMAGEMDAFIKQGGSTLSDLCETYGETVEGVNDSWSSIFGGGTDESTNTDNSINIDIQKTFQDSYDTVINDITVQTASSLIEAKNQKSLHDARGNKCDLKYDLENQVDAIIDQLFSHENESNIARTVLVDVWEKLDASTMSEGDLKEAGHALAIAAEGAGEGVSTAAKGAGEGVGNAAGGVFGGIGGMLAGNTLLFIVIGVCIIGAVYFYMQSKTAGKNLSNVPTTTG